MPPMESMRYHVARERARVQAICLCNLRFAPFNQSVQSRFLTSLLVLVCALTDAAARRAIKAHFQTKPGYGPQPVEKHDPPLLYHLAHDPSERFDVAKDHPELLAEIARIVESHRATLEPVKSLVNE